MKLIIAEKPSLARDIAQALGVTQKRDGYIEGNNYMVTWCIGHLVELANPEVYDEKLKQWSFSTLPFIPDSFKYTINPQTAKQFKIIKELSNNPKIQSLINCADAGREGELIFHLVYLLTGCKKPVERLWISSLTKDEILKGFNNLKPAAHYAGLRDSAHARQRSDWLIGLNITRAFTLRLRSFKNIIGDGNSGKSELYSVGRVQTPTLAFIVNRENEINNFVPEKFYQVLATFDSTVGTYQGLWVGPDGFRIAEEKQAKAIVDKVLGQDGIIEKVDKKLVKEKSPLLHDLTSLQRVANTKYGLTADQTLKIAQSLYESKLITYPRTSSQYLSTSVANEINEHLEACNVGIYSQFVNQIKSQKVGVKLTSRHVQNDKVTDHHAIIPTKLKADLSSLDGDQRKVYDLVLRRFLAAFFPESEIEQTTVFTLVLGERFVSKGKVIINPGWRVVESSEALSSDSSGSTTSKSKSKGKGKDKSSNPEDFQQEDEDKDKLLPPLKQNQTVKTTLAEVLEKWTKPPSRYTEATLLSAMETAGKDIADDVLRQIMKDQGLGTPATRAGTIETLISREYIFRDKKSLKPTDKGKLLIELLPSPLLKSAKLTAEWEQKLAEMAKGSYSLQAFMDEIKQATRELVKEVVTSNIADSPFLSRMKDEQQKEGKGSQSQEAEEGLICPNCVIEERKGRLVERTGQYGKFLCCSLGKEICKYISQVPKNQKQRKALVESRCPNCQGATKLHLPKEKDRSPVLLCLNYNECKGVVRLEDIGSGNSKAVSKGVVVSDKSTNEQGNKQGNTGNKQAKTSSATEPMTKNNQAEKGLPCPKCVIEKREGRLIENTGQYGNFLCCELGKEVCGYISSVPKDQKQRKALVESRCPNCKGATKLKFPTGKDKSPLLICLNYNECKGLIRLYNASAITPFDQNTHKNTDSSFIGSINHSNSDGFSYSNDLSNNKQSDIMKPVIVQSEFQRDKQTQAIIKNQNKILLRPGITNPKLWFPERPPEDEWRKIRQAVMERDNWTCASCGHRALKWMNTHHLSDSGDNNVENLVPLCVACHAVYHVGRSLMNGVVEIWKSDISQVEIVQRTRQGIIDGLSLAEIKAQLPIKPGFYPANSVDYANNLIKKMGNKPRAYLDEPLCAVFIKLEQWQVETDVKKITEANNFVSAKEIGQMPTQPLCKVCGKATVKRSFKDKQGKEKYFWGCSGWKPNNQGCNATPVWIN